MRFVGGAVRNTLLGIPFDDVDFATSYHPEEIIQFFQDRGCKVIPTGLAHGTVTVVMGGHPYEITTLRRDVETDGRHAVIAYTPMWIEDAQRRDFTMNALYVDHQGYIHDDVGGQLDIALGLIRFIGDSEKRITEDYLRILRFFRFWALYGANADDAGLTACVRLKDHLDQLSSERITKEMLKLLTADHPWPVVRIMHAQGFDPLVWGHDSAESRIDALEALEKIWGKAAPLVRLAMLTGSMPERLTLSRDQKKQLQTLWTPLDRNNWWFSVYDFGVPMTQARVWMWALHHLLSAIEHEGLTASAPLPHTILAQLDSCKKDMGDLEQQIFPEFQLTGRDVMTYGIVGPAVGDILQQTKSWWIQNRCQANRDECIQYVEQRIQNQIQRSS